ncbi:hypothetical protein GLAREA_02677 [Glarea lozoyensis ATCC 20868]|uniref:Uncharacterized protein n=1 Tax=Glarea lozoyensis (strain ATCC 20868 / MF5171) TaxID=1116229 RepID=S3DJQ4_GLAL2|nr:uncharacterized protein GLAREA_02677 [Glarea lozoyensis ATCC 20868]EPE26763.1 hypothetical protein GLAREA_02677 [Glarea lozoyensis ATCC 20868]
MADVRIWVWERRKRSLRDGHGIAVCAVDVWRGVSGGLCGAGWGCGVGGV